MLTGSNNKKADALEIILQNQKPKSVWGPLLFIFNISDVPLGINPIQDPNVCMWYKCINCC
jgi:hypothetical protein